MRKEKYSCICDNCGNWSSHEFTLDADGFIPSEVQAYPRVCNGCGKQSAYLPSPLVNYTKNLRGQAKRIIALEKRVDTLNQCVIDLVERLMTQEKTDDTSSAERQSED